jgi:hypothetical protein
MCGGGCGYSRSEMEGKGEKWCNVKSVNACSLPPKKGYVIVYQRSNWGNERGRYKKIEKKK